MRILVVGAYYLAHSMATGERGFAERDRQAARIFAQAAAGPSAPPGAGSLTLRQ